MTPDKQFAKVGDLAIHYDVADYTDPWRTGDRHQTFSAAHTCGGSTILWSTLNW